MQEIKHQPTTKYGKDEWKVITIHKKNFKQHKCCVAFKCDIRFISTNNKWWMKKKKHDETKNNNNKSINKNYWEKKYYCYFENT